MQTSRATFQANPYRPLHFGTNPDPKDPISTPTPRSKSNSNFKLKYLIAPLLASIGAVFAGKSYIEGVSNRMDKQLSESILAMSEDTRFKTLCATELTARGLKTLNERAPFELAEEKIKYSLRIPDSSFLHWLQSQDKWDQARSLFHAEKSAEREMRELTKYTSIMEAAIAKKSLYEAATSACARVGIRKSLEK